MRSLLSVLLSAALWLSGMIASPAGADAVDAKSQSITIALLQEPPNLDSTRTTDLVSFFVLGHVGEGLVRYDRRGRLVPAVAERWEQQANRLVFHLREDARWSDGSPVIADDFVYAWRLINDPDYGAPYAAIMYPIRNAQAVQQGEAPMSALGVSAPDPRTLIVDLESPCGYCLSLMVHAAFYPIKQSFHESAGDTYGAEPDRLLYNGPFRLTDWVHGARLTLERNPQYWDAESVPLNRIEVGYITEDNHTRLNLFRDGQIALARLGAETVKDAVAQGMRLRTFVSGGMAYLSFNLREGRPTSDVRLRRAIQAAFDADEFVNKVIAIPGYRPAYSFFPSWVPGVESTFLEEYPVTRPPLDYARAEALAADFIGDGAPPTLTLLTVTSPTGAKIAEYWQGLIKQRLGIDVRVDQQTFKQYLQKIRNGDFDIALSSWYPDYGDIATYADLLASWNPNNRGQYQNDDYDRHLETVLRSPDQRERMDAARELHRLIRSDVPVLPMAETGSAYLVHPQLRGVVRRVLGADPDYTGARVVPP